MKELSIEQKAKAYEEAIERAKVFKEHLLEINDKGYADEMDYIFPQLKESEDERIREELIQYFKNFTLNTFAGLDPKRILSWLEKQESVGEIVERCKNSWYNEGKIAGMAEGLTNDEKYQQGWHDALENQGEQKAVEEYNIIGIGSKNAQGKLGEMLNSADKSELKFKVGDWITDGKALLCITKFEIDYGYELKAIDGTVFHFASQDLVDANYHLWTIQDAKDGDVLAAHECLVLFREIDGLNIRCYCTYHFMNNPSFYVDTLQNKDAFHPATKEQRDALMKAMTDAGYTFDFEKKELKKIHVIDEGKAEMDYCFTKMMNGEKISSAWSEEDEMIALSIGQVMNCASLLNIVPEKIDKIRTWLKSLKDRVGCEVNCTTKKEWSEEDEEYLDDIIRTLRNFVINGGSGAKKYTEEEITWLKSLKDRYTWKPSDRQMASITCAVRKMKASACYDSELVSLYQDLKKLREE